LGIVIVGRSTISRSTSWTPVVAPEPLLTEEVTSPEETRVANARSRAAARANAL